MGKTPSNNAGLETEVLDALRQIIDPDLHKDVVECGFIKQLEIREGKVSFVFEMTTPACPMKDSFEAQVYTCLSGIT